MTDLFFRMARAGKLVYAVTESIPEKDRLEPPEFAGHWDPHVWGDPNPVEQVHRHRGRWLEQGRPRLVRRATPSAVKRSSRRTRRCGPGRSSASPPCRGEQRILVTSHDAFNYFGQAFGFQVVAVQGLSTVTEAGLADIVKTVDFIKQKKIKAIFVESSVNPAAIKRVSKDSDVKIGGELFSDACGSVGRHARGSRREVRRWHLHRHAQAQRQHRRRRPQVSCHNLNIEDLFHFYCDCHDVALGNRGRVHHF